MAEQETHAIGLQAVPEDVLPRGKFPPLRYRAMPEPIAWHRMIGPSVIAAGVAIGSGELIFWPYLTYTYGLAIVWAGMLGVTTQFFINMEIERYTLLTSETSVAGFGRLWRPFGLIFLVCTVLPLIWPGWVAGAARIMTWILHPSATEEVLDEYQRLYAIGSVILCAVALILSPVVYPMMERLQQILVAFILAVLFIATVAVSRFDTLGFLVKSAADLSYLKEISANNAWPILLGAIAYAGLGGMANLVQGHYIREKGFAMGKYAGKIVSPLTGPKEAVFSETGYFFEPTPENMAHWRRWWRAANWEHFLSFFCLTAISILLLSFLAYHTVFGMEGYGKGISFLKAEAEVLSTRFGGLFRYAFLWMGWVILFTTQIGVLDLFGRLCADIIKRSWLTETAAWTESRIYSVIVILVALFAIIVFGVGLEDPRTLLTLGAALNGCVMFIYAILLLYMNRFKLPREVRMSVLRAAIMIWAVLFFGVFSILTVKATIANLIG